MISATTVFPALSTFATVILENVFIMYMMNFVMMELLALRIIVIGYLVVAGSLEYTISIIGEHF
jgi:hypothetical protein